MPVAGPAAICMNWGVTDEGGGGTGGKGGGSGGGSTVELGCVTGDDGCSGGRLNKSGCGNGGKGG